MIDVEELERQCGQTTFAIEAEDLLIDRIFTNLVRDSAKGGFYVDIGAFSPVRASNTYHLYKKGWRGINVDARPGALAEFERLRPEDINVEMALAAQAGHRLYSMFDDGLLNGFLDMDIISHHLRNGKKLLKQVKLACHTVDELLRDYLPPGKTVDLLNIDVELYEREILSTWNFEVHRPAVVCIEIHGGTIRQLMATDVAQLLDLAGYEYFSRMWHSSIFLDKKYI